MTGYLLSAAGGGLVGFAVVSAHMGLIVVGLVLIAAGIAHNIERKR